MVREYSRSELYRVWNEEEKKYYPVLNWCFWGRETFTIQYNPVKKLQDVTPEIKIYESDINGIPIFAGDIVLFSHFDDMIEDEESDEFVIDHNNCEVSIVEKDGEVNGDFADWSSWLIKYASDSDYSFEVIGTVNENPELVEKYKLKRSNI